MLGKKPTTTKNALCPVTERPPRSVMWQGKKYNSGYRMLFCGERERGVGGIIQISDFICLNLNLRRLSLWMVFLNHVNALSLADRLHDGSQFFTLPPSSPLLQPHCGWNVLSQPLTWLGHVTCFVLRHQPPTMLRGPCSLRALLQPHERWSCPDEHE